jgi:hypothetical protein
VGRAMKKGQTSNANFFTCWLNYKIEKLREIERLCSAIMDVLEIAEVPSKGIARVDIDEGETVNRDYAVIPPPLTDLDWGREDLWKLRRSDWDKAFDEMVRGEKIVYVGFRHWYTMNRGGRIRATPFFHEGDTNDVGLDSLWMQAHCVDTNHSLWIKTHYDENIDSFQTIRDDCMILSQLLESVDAAYDEKDFEAIEDTVNGVIQGAFTLIGTHDREHKITGKLHEYEMQEQERKKADEIMQEGRAKGGRVPKKNAAILEAVKEFIIERPQRIEQKAGAIARSFKRDYESSQPSEITVDSIKYDVYCDGKKVWSRSATGEKGKYHDKSISYSTFVTRYIPEAKRAVSASNRHKS